MLIHAPHITLIRSFSSTTCQALGYASGIATDNSVYASSQVYAQGILSCSANGTSLANCTFGGYTRGYDEVEVACAAAGGEG